MITHIIAILRDMLAQPVYYTSSEVEEAIEKAKSAGYTYGAIGEFAQCRARKFTPPGGYRVPLKDIEQTIGWLKDPATPPDDAHNVICRLLADLGESPSPADRLAANQIKWLLRREDVRKKLAAVTLCWKQCEACDRAALADALAQLTSAVEAL
jgi:hypothetical protein